MPAHKRNSRHSSNLLDLTLCHTRCMPGARCQRGLRHRLHHDVYTQERLINLPAGGKPRLMVNNNPGLQVADIRIGAAFDRAAAYCAASSSALRIAISALVSTTISAAAHLHRRATAHSLHRTCSSSPPSRQFVNQRNGLDILDVKYGF